MIYKEGERLVLTLVGLKVILERYFEQYWFLLLKVLITLSRY